MPKEIKDPALYHKLSEPFADRNAAAAAFDAFFADVRAARERHKIQDCTVIIQADYMENEKPSTILTYGHNGNSFHAMPMVASILGYLKSDQEKAIERMAAKGN